MRPFDTAEQFDVNNYASFHSVKKSNDISAFMRLSSAVLSKSSEADMKHFDKARYENFKWRTSSMKRPSLESAEGEVSSGDEAERMFHKSPSSDTLLLPRTRANSSPPIHCNTLQ
jgi:hypothetical protein